MTSASRKQMYGNNLGQSDLPALNVTPTIGFSVKPEAKPKESKFAEDIRAGKIKVVPNQLWPDTESVRLLNPFAF